MRILSFILMLIFWSSSASSSEGSVLKIYHDSDWSNNTESSEAIWRGMEVALAEVDYTVNGMRIELVKKNHSGNVTRSLRNLKTFLGDPDGIAVFSGMHSPPLITNRGFINANKIPVLVPWAAGGPITRYPSPDNSVFRLSVDDTKAGEALVNFAIEKHKCRRPYLLLENTPWGDSNVKNIRKALNRTELSPAGTKRFGLNLKSHVARSIVQDVLSETADCVILVAAASEGAEISLAMSELPEEARLPIISHWGITGGSFHEIVPHKTRELIELSFIQTCFSFLHKPRSPHSTRVFADLRSLYPEDISTPKNLASPVGFIHAYDLTKILIVALGHVQLTEDMPTNRDLLRESLENLEGPIEGLVKTYNKPFAQFSRSNVDAHEALGRDDLCMATYGSNDEIIVYESFGEE